MKVYLISAAPTEVSFLLQRLHEYGATAVRPSGIVIPWSGTARELATRLGPSAKGCIFAEITGDFLAA